METMLEIEEEISDYELERGKPMPSLAHAMTQLKLSLLISEYSDYVPLPELSLDLQGFKPVPDIAVFLKSTIQGRKDSLRISEPPLLAIEILSPKQALSDLFAKSDEYLTHGVEEVWVIIPEIQSITVCKRLSGQQTFISGDVRHGSTGIVVNIEKLFTA